MWESEGAVEEVQLDDMRLLIPMAYTLPEELAVQGI